MPTLSFSLSCPLPAGLRPQVVVEALHQYEPLIVPNPYLVSFRRRPVDLAEIVDDDFFTADGHALAAFEVVDRIVLVPGLATKQVVIPCVMQQFAGGLRCRSMAAGGVKVWSTWRIVAVPPADNDNGRRTSTRSTTSRTRARSRSWSRGHDTVATAVALPLTPPATPPNKGAGNNDTTTTAYELVEEARVECGSLVKPFVGRSFQSAHLAILRSVVRELVQQQKTP